MLGFLSFHENLSLISIQKVLNSLSHDSGNYTKEKVAPRKEGYCHLYYDNYIYQVLFLSPFTISTEGH